MIQESNTLCKFPGLDSTFYAVFWLMVFCYQIVLTYCEKNCSIDREKLLKFETEGREFAKCLRSLEQFIQTVKGQNKFC